MIITILHIFLYQYLSGKITLCGMYVAFGVLLASCLTLFILLLHKHTMTRIAKESFDPTIIENTCSSWEKGSINSIIIITGYLSLFATIYIAPSPTTFVTINPALYGSISLFNVIFVVLSVVLISTLIYNIWLHKKNTSSRMICIWQMIIYLYFIPITLPF